MTAAPAPAPASALTTPIYQHDAQKVLPHLATNLPHCISLFRRVQHGVAHPSPTARVLATFPPDSTPPRDAPWLAARVDLFRGRETQVIIYSSIEARHSSNQPIRIARAAAGSAAPALDADAGVESSYIASTFDAPESVLDIVRDQLMSLLAYIKINLLPAYLDSLSLSSAKAADSGTAQNETKNHASRSEVGSQRTLDNKNATANGMSQITSNGNSTKAATLIPAPSPHAFLIGTLHTALFSLLQRNGFHVFGASKAASDGSSATPLPGFRVHRFDDPPYLKFLFRRDAFITSDTPLPPGYRFHDRQRRVGVLESQFALVQARTHIPRSREQLRLMPSSAVYVDQQKNGKEKAEDEDEAGEGEMPIAWAFLGLDGALATLHVEEEHRGKGLALALSKETMRNGLKNQGIFGANGIGVDSEVKGEVEGWVHTEVAQYNVASRRVMEKIGGEVLSTVTWTVIEVC